MESYQPLIKLLLPEFILNHFDLTSVDQQEQTFHLHLEELNKQPEEGQTGKLLSKGFFPCITVQDFPIRGHRVLLHIKRRRWLNTQTGKVIYRDWNQVAQGTRMTNEFATFLKELGGY